MSFELRKDYQYPYRMWRLRFRTMVYHWLMIAGYRQCGRCLVVKKKELFLKMVHHHRCLECQQKVNQKRRLKDEEMRQSKMQQSSTNH